MSIIHKLNWNPDRCNTYVIGEEGKPCVVIDPGDNDNGRLDNYLQRHHSLCQGILITHGHYDHIAGLASLKGLATVFMSEDEIDFLTNSRYNLQKGFALPNLNPYELEDEDEIKLGNYIFKTIETPFHTHGSVCFYLESEKALFSGDTLFHLGIGRTDLPTGDDSMVEDSLRKLMNLPPETKVYPGHGVDTTIANELSFNPFFPKK